MAEHDTPPPIHCPNIDFVPKGDHALSDDNSRARLKSLYIGCLWLALPLQTSTRKYFGARYLSTANAAYSTAVHVLIIIMALALIPRGMEGLMLFVPFIAALALRYWLLLPVVMGGVFLIGYTFPITPLYSKAAAGVLIFAIIGMILSLWQRKKEASALEKAGTPVPSYYYGKQMGVIPRYSAAFWQTARLALRFIVDRADAPDNPRKQTLKGTIEHEYPDFASSTYNSGNVAPLLAFFDYFVNERAHDDDRTMNLFIEPAWTLAVVFFCFAIDGGTPIALVALAYGFASWCLSLMQQHAIKRHNQDIADVIDTTNVDTQRPQKEEQSIKTVHKAGKIRRE